MPLAGEAMAGGARGWTGGGHEARIRANAESQHVTMGRWVRPGMLQERQQRPVLMHVSPENVVGSPSMQATACAPATRLDVTISWQARNRHRRLRGRGYCSGE